MKRFTIALLLSACLAVVVAAPAMAAPIWGIGVVHKNIYGVGGATSPYSGSDEAFARESAANAYSIQVTNSALAVGATLTCEPGVWTGSPSFAYRWYRDGVAIAGATANAYVTQAADTGTAVQCAAIGTNAGGGSIRFAAPRQLGSSSAASGLPRPGGPKITASNGGSLSSKLTCKPEFGWRWPVFGYQWLRNGAPIAGATAATYAVKVVDAHSAIQCVVTGGNLAGAVSAASAVLNTTPAPSPAVPTASAETGPSISGGDSADAAGGVGAGVVLTCEAGPASATLSYEWLRNTVPIAGATESTYTTVAADEGKLVQCQATASTAEGTTTATTAAQAISPSPSTPPPGQDTPVVTGTPSVGNTLTCDAGSWTGSPSIAYQWLRNGVPIEAATSSAYPLVLADASSSLQCQVTGANAGGSVIADSTPQPIEPTVPYLKTELKTDRPSISGIAGVGSTLTCNSGTWVGSPTFDYAWLRNAQPIAGANGQTYTVAAADEGKSLQCLVTGSNAVAVVKAISFSVDVGAVSGAPKETGQFVITTSENRRIGETVVCGPTAFSNLDPTTTFRFQWLRNGVPIPGAEETKTGSAGSGYGYTIDLADLHTALQCSETVANANGSTTAMVSWRFSGVKYIDEAPPAATASLSVADTVSVAIDLPAGLELASGAKLGGEGSTKSSSDDAGGFEYEFQSGSSPSVQAIVASGWNCSVITVVCTRKGLLPAGASYPPIVLHVRVAAGAADLATPLVAVSGGGAATVSASDPTEVVPEVPFGVTAFSTDVEDEAGLAYSQAGGHPFSASTEILANVTPAANATLYNAGGDPREIQADLPPGFSGNAQNFPQCEPRLFNLLGSEGPNGGTSACPLSTAVGYINVSLPNSVEGSVFNNGNGLSQLEAEALGQATSPLYNLVPNRGLPAQLGFKVLGFPYYLDAKLRSDSDYGLTIGSSVTPAQLTLDGVRVTVCANGVTTKAKAFPHSVTRPVWTCAPAPPDSTPFLSNPSKCAGDAPLTTLRANSYQHPSEYSENGAYSGAPPASSYSYPGHPVSGSPVESSFLQGCEELTEQFHPTLSFQPDATQAETPTGADVDLAIPQTNRADTPMAPALKTTVVNLPEGVSLSPSAANGLAACSTEQIGLIGTGFGAPNPIHFDQGLIECPSSSKLGTLEVESPLLAEPLSGAIYLAAQDDNPFHSTFAIYLAIDDPKTGLVIKLPGRVDADAQTGRLTTTFDNNPQLPLEHVRLHFFGGPQASLATPPTCGEKTTVSQLVPWSAADPDNPAPSEVSTSSDSFDVDSGSGGAPCASSVDHLPFKLGMDSGSANPLAGRTSPFSFRITRPDGAQQIDSLTLSPPPGFAAYLKGVPYCSEAAIQAAAGRSGREELASASCPAASQIGRLEVGAGPGSNPFYVSGKLYLAGPYKGAPVSAVAITPAAAGPFDLGNVVVRSAIYVDPGTAQITTKTDPFPRLLRGVPLDLRDIRVNLDRSNWALNPTSCNQLSVLGTATGAGGATTSLSNRYQLGGCTDLGFKPKLKLALKGGTKRDDNPALIATLTQPPNQANIASVSVALPHSEFLDQDHIRTICTRPRFAEHTCPPGSIYGHAEAETPLLDGKLTGSVYLRASGNQLPDLVVALRGPDDQPIEIVLDGRIDSVHGGIRNSFDFVPDAPVTRFTLRMQGGKKGLLVNSRDLCRKKARAIARVVGYNGMRADQFPVLANGCKKAEKRHHGKR